MPYDPNRPMGLDALSPTVSAYKQFVEGQNRVDDANVVPFLLSRGEPQLAGLIAKKLRVENAAKAQQQLAQQPQAAPPTVSDQYNMAAQQQDQQARQAMMAQMAQMQAAQQAQAAPGLAGMPNPVMEKASFAGGGMVAFADGGGVQHFDGMTGSQVGNDPDWAEYSQLQQKFSNPFNTPANNPGNMQLAADYQRYTQLKNKFNPSYKTASATTGIFDYTGPKREFGPTAPNVAAPAPVVAAPAVAKKAPAAAAATAPTTAAAPEEKDTSDLLSKLLGDRPDFEKFKEEQKALQARTNKALDAEKDYLEKSAKDYGADKEEAKARFWLNLGASLLGNTSPHFMNALGDALKDSSSTLVKDLQALKTSQDKLELQRLDLEYKRAQAEETGTERAYTRFANAQNQYNTLAVARQNHLDNITQSIENRAANIAHYKALEANAGGLQGQIVRSMVGQINPATGKPFANQLEVYQAMTSASPTVSAANIRANTSLINKLMDDKTKLGAQRLTAFTEDQRKNIDSQIADIDRQLIQLRAQNSAAGAAPTGAAPTGAPTGRATFLEFEGG